MNKKDTQKRNPNIHPGEILAKEFLLPLEISAYQLAKATYMPQSRISEIVSGNRAVSADTALRLSKFFGNSARFWLGLQMEHDIRDLKREQSFVFDKIKKYSTEK